MVSTLQIFFRTQNFKSVGSKTHINFVSTKTECPHHSLVNSSCSLHQAPIPSFPLVYMTLQYIALSSITEDLWKLMKEKKISSTPLYSRSNYQQHVVSGLKNMLHELFPLICLAATAAGDNYIINHIMLRKNSTINSHGSGKGINFCNRDKTSTPFQAFFF